jgi:preprotein translocase subunit SecG
MSDFLLYASVVALFLVCILVVLVILMQRPSANAGMGSALGGGAAETVFGGESANVLSKMTTTLTVILFVLSFGLYLGFVAREKPVSKALDAKATAPVVTPAATAPVAAPAATAPAAPSVPAPAAAKPQSTPAPAATTPAKPAAPAPAK